MMTSCAADDSGVSLSLPDEWIVGRISPAQDPNYVYEVVAETTGESQRNNEVIERANLQTSVWPVWEHLKYYDEETTTTFAGENRCYDVVERINAKNSWNPAGDPRSDVISSSRFTDEQIVCICLALQQKQDFDKLEEFLSEISLRSDLAAPSRISPSSLEICDAATLPVTSSCTVRQDYTTPCPKKTKQICFCQNCVKFSLILIIFGRKMANNPNICEVHSFSTSPNLRHYLTVLNANVPNCYITPNVVICNKLLKT